jgi:hypothetical protein
MRRWWFLGLWLALMGEILAQNGAANGPLPERSLPALKAVAEPLSTAISELDRLAEEQKIAASEERKQELSARIEAERERIEQFRNRFREIVGGADATAFEVIEVKKVPLQEQFSELLEPLVGALREPTSQLRQTEEMRKALEVWSDRVVRAGRLVARIDALLALASDERVKSELQSARRIWIGRQSEAAGEAEILRLRVEERDLNTPTMWESFSKMFGGFWRNRGLNLLLAVLAAVGGFIAVRRSYCWLRRVIPVHRKDKGTLTSRVSDLIAIFVAVLVSIIAVLLVFYLRGDWLLLTVAAVMLIGAAWAGKTALPPYIAQIRMMLNMGTVREGERLIYRGLPWRVKSLGFFTIFTNPELEGGDLRIPLGDVMGMISRDGDPEEPWFPTRQGDWVMLSDGTYGKVVRQTPEQVVVLKLGGSLKTFPTGEFIELIPENLSHGFRIQSLCELDYSHQSIATGEAVEIISQAFEQGLIRELGREGIKSVRAEFRAAAASSLELVVLADFAGELAPRYNLLERALQRMWVDVCNERGWIIPFTQITLHQAGPASLPELGKNQEAPE